MSKAHFLKLCEFTPSLMKDGLTVAQKFLKIIYEKDTSVDFAVVTANYLFPAGASLIHPHLQMIITPVPYSYHARLIKTSSTYYRENSSPYFIDLVQEEKTGPRYVTQRGQWHWVAPFSPMGNNEFMAIHETKADFGSLTSSDLKDLSYGISRVLAFYETLGHLSFNYAERRSLSRCLSLPYQNH